MNSDAAMREKRAAGSYFILRRRLLPVLVAGCFGTAAANPLGPQVVNGQASFVNQGNLLSITNTPGAIINWQSFSINPGEITRFIQQNPNSAVLNRIVGQDPSQILGALQSNGRVFLINPNGILFGQGAQVDVNGLVASTLNLSNEDFLKGKLDFKAGDKAGNLKNQGAISTPAGGQVVLIAPNVENSGIITSPKGEVMLAAGHSVQLVDTLNPDLRVVVSAPESEALNLGQIITQGGKTGIYGALVKQRGLVNADSAVVGENGKVILKASRDTLLEAGSRTTARGAGKGGEVQVLGERVALTGDAQVDASGQQGGGTVLVGGDYLGKNADVPNARQTYVGKNASINTDAVQQGDGGKVVVWSDETTRAYGRISARGGQQGGNGGFVETSGHHLDVSGITVDSSASNGSRGRWLLDPYDIEVKTAGGSTTLADFDAFSDPPGTGVSIVSASTISASATNVTLQASHDITFTDATNITTAGVNLAAFAGNNIHVNNSIATNGGTVQLTANAAGAASGSGSVNITSAVTSSGGNVSLSGHHITINGPGSVTTSSGAAAGTITLNATGNISLIGGMSTSTTTPAAISASANGNISVQSAVSASGSTGGFIDFSSTGGNIEMIGAGGSFTANGVGGKVRLQAPNGKVTTDSVGVVLTAADVIIKAANGIHGPVTAGPPVTTASMLVNATNLDVKNTASGLVQISGSAAGGMTVKDLDADNFSIVQGSSSDPVVISNGTNLTVDNDTSSLNNGYYHFNAGNTLTVATPIRSTNGSVFLLGSAVDVQEEVTAKMVELRTDSLTIDGATGMITSTGEPTATTSGGMRIEPFSATQITLDTAGASLVIDPAKLTTSPQTAGKIAASHFEFSAGSSGTVDILAPVSLPAAQLKFAGGTVTVGANVTGEAIHYRADTLGLSAAVTTATGTDKGIMISPWTVSRTINIAATDPSNALWIDSGKLGNFVGRFLEFGDVQSDGTPVSTGNILVSAPISGSVGTFTNLGFATTGSITQASAADIISLPTCGTCGHLELVGGSIALNPAPNSVDTIRASGSSIAYRNAKALGTTALVAKSPGGSIDLQVNGNFTSSGPIQTQNGNVTIVASAANSNISISPPGIDSCYLASAGTCTSLVDLNATGSISIPLVKAGNRVTLTAGTDVIDADGSLNNITGGGASAIELAYTVGGSISLDAWGATEVAGSTVTGTNGLRLTQPSSGGGGGTAAPTLADCTSNPTLSGCSAVLPPLSTCMTAPSTAGCSVVLPSLSTCTTAPTTAGCSVVLPTVDACTAEPTTAGCTAVLPTLSTCTTAPATAGCSVVLPTLSTCTTAPTTAGCSAVLPTVDACTADPTKAGCSAVLPTLGSCTTAPATVGCSVVLPTLSACTTAPTTAGCSVVLPSLDACTADLAKAGCTAVLPTLSTCTTNPSQAGCSAVLPTLTSCTANPTQTGCSAVLPKFDSCVANPTQAGCSAVLPSLDTCTATPTLSGCQSVLPSLEQCSANPAQAGCSAVVAAASKCVVKPDLPECQTVLPGTSTGNPGTGANNGSTGGTTSNTTTSTITTTVMETINTVVSTTVSAQASAAKVSSGSGTSSGGGGSTTPAAEKSESKKEEKKTTSPADDSGAKNEKPATKMYCN